MKLKLEAVRQALNNYLYEIEVQKEGETDKEVLAEWEADIAVYEKALDALKEIERALEIPCPITHREMVYRLEAEDFSAQITLTHEGIIGDLWAHPTEDNQYLADTFAVLWSDIAHDSANEESEVWTQRQ